jgi:hypothetical protein
MERVLLESKNRQSNKLVKSNSITTSKLKQHTASTHAHERTILHNPSKTPSAWFTCKLDGRYQLRGETNRIHQQDRRLVEGCSRSVRNAGRISAAIDIIHRRQKFHCLTIWLFTNCGLISKSEVSRVKRLTTYWFGSYLEFRYHSDGIFVLHSLPNKNEIDGACS